jgi:CDP-paratose 2-epimerase
MDVALVTGAGGLAGSEAARLFAARGFKVAGIDNDLRRYFFGEAASTVWKVRELQEQVPGFESFPVDVRDLPALQNIFERLNSDIRVVVHAAAQPSHDWAAREPLTDFSVNAGGTLNLLELTRRFCPGAGFIFLSTNKVYGDLPNALPLEEGESRWDLPENHPRYKGVDESMSIDQSTHSLFGASKLAADVLVQEYGRYFGMNTVSLRCGCLTGPGHSGVELHGFLAYLMKCCATGAPYTIFGYAGKQVRDNIHGADLAEAFWRYYQDPRPGEVYNIGGGRARSCSVREAVALCERITGKTLNYRIDSQARGGDHKWYISDASKFERDYPDWAQKHGLEETLREIYEKNADRWAG